MKSTFDFQNAVIDSTLYIADVQANLQNEILNYSDIFPEGNDNKVELALFYFEIQDEILQRNASEMILNMIQALNLEVTSTLQVALKKQKHLPLRVLEKSKIKRFIFFGIPPDRFQLHVDVNKYGIYRWNNMDFLFCDSLPALINDKEIRMKLWFTLKNLFGLK